MARRKKKQEEHENHERWLVSYADFITLLFAFFVVMYSISAVNEGKYRVLSDSISAAFDPSRAGLPIKLSSPLKPPILERDLQSSSAISPGMSSQYPSMASGPEPTKQDRINLRKISGQIKRSLGTLIDQGLINVKSNDLWVEIEIKSSILYASGNAHLSRQAIPVLQKIARTLAKFPNHIQVEGFTDNVPIRTPTFPSNWELSAARAASVVSLFARSGISPKRLSAIGYAEFKPIASNKTAKGRQKNRRISIIVQSEAIAKRTNRTEQFEASLADKRKAASARNSSRTGTTSDKALGAPINLLPAARYGSQQ